MWFWHVKNSEEEKNWADELDGARDSYDRQDNYNVFGILVFFSLSFKHAIGRLTNTFEIINKEVELGNLIRYQSPLSNLFMMDSLLPLVRYSLKNTKSLTL